MSQLQSIATSGENTPIIPLQDASMDIWDAKYRLKSREGAPVDADIAAMHRRVACALARVERRSDVKNWERRFLWALENGAIPAGRILSNAGAEQYKPKTSLINCTVARCIEDSMEGILDGVKDAGMTLKAGCGIGYDFSTLRPKGAAVRGAGASTSGPLPFMDVFDRTCFTIRSAGDRRGAQMGCLDIGHPDVVEFVQAKRESGRLRQFNLSILITAEFIQAVEQDAEWDLAFPASLDEVQAAQGGPDSSFRLIYRDFPTGFHYDEQGRCAMRVYCTIRARELWELIMKSTYDYADPGFILIDEVNRMNNLWFCEDIRATNP